MITTRFVALTRLLVISTLGLEVGAVWLLSAKPELEPAWRILHLLQMTLLIVLVIVSRRQIPTESSHWKRLTGFVLAALTFSIIGDFINSGLIDLSSLVQPQQVLSIIPFALAQFIYVLMFWRSSSVSPEHGDVDAISNFKLAGLVLWLPLSVALWFSVFSDHMPTIVERATLFYTCLVLLMGITSTWVWRVWGDIGSWVTIGALAFLVSDAMIGIAISKGVSPSGIGAHIIWVLYFMAQCLIARLPVLGLAMEARIPDYPEGYEDEFVAPE